MKLIIPTLVCSLVLFACGQSPAADGAHHAAAVLGVQTQPLADAAAVKEALQGKQVLLKFGATWCPPCQKIAPELAALAKERSDITVVDIDTDSHPAIAQAYGVQSIPALFLLKEGKVVAKTGGYQPKAKIIAWADAELAK